MIFKQIKIYLTSVVAGMFLMGCGATALVSTPVENIDAVPLKISELSKAEKEFVKEKQLYGRQD